MMMPSHQSPVTSQTPLSLQACCLTASLLITSSQPVLPDRAASEYQGSLQYEY
ncbi:hypothetical protein IF1G_03810 [Cordyceps javanica]|uniref:Uncharacterized protein n=1 Tax=Cordyceps javanica TaxID=43265 RepID=A0A545V8L0_9HYPO|nr:hypothetical protein IF1G_03810 [Cordyceps javanica]